MLVLTLHVYLSGPWVSIASTGNNKKQYSTSPSHGIGSHRGVGGDRHILRESTVATVQYVFVDPKRARESSRKQETEREGERASDREMGRHGGRGRYTCYAIATTKAGLSKHNKQNTINKTAGN